MEKVLKKNSSLFFLIVLLFFVSCNDKITFTKYKSLPNGNWEAHKNISFEFDIVDTISPKNLFINIRNNKEYAYSNLYVITELNFPNGDKIIDTLQYIKENKLFYKEEKVFPKSGKYVFNIQHAMRKNGEVKAMPILEGVQDVGFSIEKIE